MMKLLHLSGSARQRGQIHGEQLRSQIAGLLELWKTDIEQETGLPADLYIERFQRGTDFASAVQRWTPHLLDEVHGIAEGAHQPFDTIFSFQCMDEDWWFRHAIAGSSGHCTAFGIYGREGPPLLAQNMDIHRMTDGYQVLLHVQENGLEAFVFSVAGFIGLAGLNSRPLGVCCNTLLQLNRSGAGLPVAFVIRGLLERPDVEAAEAFLRGVKHASGQNYLIGAADEIRDFECSAGAVVPFRAGRKRVWHTNHPLVNRDLRPGEKPSSASKPGASDSHRRLEALKTALGRGNVDAAVVKSALGRPPVCVDQEPGNSLYTSGSLVMTLSDPPELQITQGPPATNEYQLFKF